MELINKLLFAYDGSDCAKQALDDLQLAGLPLYLEAEVVSVAEAWMPYPISEEEDPFSTEVTGTTITRLHDRALHEAEAAQKLAAEAVAKLHDHFPDWTVTSRTYCDAPAWGVLQAAESFDPDLIVVGSHGRSALGRMIIGSVSQKVLAEARCSVRIARHRPTAPLSPVRILLGVDGTPDSQAAVEAVAVREWVTGSSVTVIAADGFAAYPISVEMAYDSQWVQAGLEAERKALEAVIEQAVSRLRMAGLKAEGSLHQGAPTPILLKAAREIGADTIFLGARGHRFMERFLIGSVSNAVATRAECSVEVVRPR